MTAELSRSAIEAHVGRWLEGFVIGLELCPFAAREWFAGRVRVVVSDAVSELTLLEELQQELELLVQQPEIETTLLVHPDVLQEFVAYNDFLDSADVLLQELELDGAMSARYCQLFFR